MSWRSIFVVLALAAGVSVWGGLRLGEWLVAHGPVATASSHHAPLVTVPVLDADGKPYTAQPPQPLVDGRMAVPEGPPQIAWQIPESSLDETKSNQVIAVATTSITMVEAQQIAAGGGSSNFTGIADVGNLMSGLNQGGQPLQPIESPQSPPPQVASRPVGNSGAWQARLRQDLQACDAESFFDRPSCAWAARNRYCTPNNAWGRVADCPAKNF
ncbi:hypothetical protein [Pusillimonas noertemannii]|uniref:Uncharacterized protein n=1 Tax=Pusillimonas noertemannii TaxID=305977 RepID=A0A2U1CIH8_9BURK|nr:hypothetical protein [Pusillimonas noertemannii]NYT70384.1 hypothetical protein [Pusillimonas noertemannii]PVY60795.1 hypothetical protein C7440_3299 [Pusillimonas noertemannii]TFL08596.1 hypothetical protein CSC72_16465 [Pusillimonas noertemannii]